jgi:hypothetical protein
MRPRIGVELRGSLTATGFGPFTIPEQELLLPNYDQSICKPLIDGNEKL